MSDEEITTLPPYFPATPKECRTDAAPFFFCFTETSRQVGSHDTQAGERGILMCQPELKQYMQCMEKKYARQ